MRENLVWDILIDLYSTRGFINSISPEALRETVMNKTGNFDKGSATRAINSLLQADILRADYGQFKYGFQGLKMLKKLGYIDDPAINIVPEIELVEHKELKKIRAEIVNHTAEGLPDVPKAYEEKAKEIMKQKKEVDENAEK